MIVFLDTGPLGAIINPRPEAEETRAVQQSLKVICNTGELGIAQKMCFLHLIGQRRY